MHGLPSRIRVALVLAVRWLHTLGADHLTPGVEAILKGNDTRLRQRQLDGLEDLLWRHAEFERDTDVALDMPLARAHDSETEDEEQLLGLAIQPAWTQIRRLD